MELVHIALGEHSYDIKIGYKMSTGELIHAALPKTKDLLIVSNETVASLYMESLQAQLAPFGFNCRTCILKDGEVYKNVDSYMQIMTTLLEDRMGRDGALVALGGGVVGDMTGFVAATYQRGVDFVQIPTTLLALVDSSVGGKTAINHPLGKNMIGAFHQPKLVIADLDYLKTLPSREIAAGMAEVIKYAVIFDREFFNYLQQNAPSSKLDLSYVVKRCCEWKAFVVSQDEKEKGMRALLNYGHTFGHAIEVGMGFGNYLHGEAVAIGMVVAAYVAHKLKGFDAEVYQSLLELLPRYDLPILIPEFLQGADFISHMHHDKKVKQGKINYVLPLSLGKSAVFNDLEDQEIADCIDVLRQEQAK